MTTPDVLPVKLFTGPVKTAVTLADGTTYNVTPAVIDVHPDHLDEVHCLIAKHHTILGEAGEPVITVAHPEIEDEVVAFHHDLHFDCSHCAKAV